jgi:exopolysaccharide biosynthesis polyprenyl glycosylphosphotransferase
MSVKPKLQHINLFSRCFDLIALVAGFSAAAVVATFMQRRGLFVWPGSQANFIAGWPPHYAVLLMASLLVWAAVSGYTGVYQSVPTDLIHPSFRKLLRTIALWASFITAAIFLLKLRGLSRQFTATFFILASFAIALRYFCQGRLLSRTHARQLERKAVVIGDAASALGLTQLLDQLHAYDSVVLAEEPHGAPAPAMVVASDANRPEQLANPPADVFLFSGSGTAITQDFILDLLRERRVVHIVPALIDAALFRYSITEIGGVPIITLSAGSLSPWQAVFKRLLDILVAAGALLISAPLMVFIAFIIKLASPGPILFRQERLGKDGSRFRIFKFRTMYADAEARLKADPQLYNRYRDGNFKLPKGEDFRITPLGRLLRSSSLDELPQLLNVLRGDMSLVGPRPIVPEEIARYDDYAKLLLSVKPGITGYWQVNGRSLISDYAARVRLDMEYIRDQSIRADLQIMLKTVSAVTRMEGAH